MSDRFICEKIDSELALMALGAALAPFLRAGDIIALRGELGAGKTTFSRGLVQSLCGGMDVPSPTYTLVQTYDCPDYELWHCDLYRLENPPDVLELGLVDMEDEIVSLIEWPDKMGRYLSPDALNIDIIFHDTGREVRFSGPDIWGQRLDNFRTLKEEQS